MQIVINIDDEDYDDITLTGENTINIGVLLDLREAVRNGTPLPKGHGKLIDADAMKKHYPIMENDFGMVFNEHLHKELDNEPTIIEADRSEEE